MVCVWETKLLEESKLVLLICVHRQACSLRFAVWWAEDTFNLQCRCAQSCAVCRRVGERVRTCSVCRSRCSWRSCAGSPFSGTSSGWECCCSSTCTSWDESSSLKTRWRESKTTTPYASTFSHTHTTYSGNEAASSFFFLTVRQHKNCCFNQF